MSGVDIASLSNEYSRIIQRNLDHFTGQLAEGLVILGVEVVTAKGVAKFMGQQTDDFGQVLRKVVKEGVSQTGVCHGKMRRKGRRAYFGKLER